jgi:hypothetical protein
LEDVYLAQKTTDAARVVYESAQDAAHRELVGTVEHAQLQRLADDARNEYAQLEYDLTFVDSCAGISRMQVAARDCCRHHAKMVLSEAELELANATTSCDDLTIQKLKDVYRDAATAYRKAQKLSEAELELANATTSCDDLTKSLIEFGNAYRDIDAAYRDNLKKKYELIYHS